MGKPRTGCMHVWWEGQDQAVQVIGVVSLAPSDDPYEPKLVPVIDYPHHEVHEGHAFEMDTYAASIADAATLILATDGAIGVEAHFTFNCACGGDATVELIEGATVNAGSARTARNMKRTVADGISGKSQPTLAGGTIIAGPILMPGGKGPNAGGGDTGTRPGLEWITDPTKSYAIRLTNISGQAKPASITANFYVPD